MPTFPVFQSSVAKSTPFDNTTNGFVADNVQDAIEEAQHTMDNVYLTGSSTVTTTSGTYSVVSGMTTTPPAGTYYVIFTGTFRIASNGADGNFAIFRAGSVVQESVRRQFTTVTIILGLIGSNIESSGVPMAKVTVDGTQLVEGRFRAASGTIACDDRSMILLRIA